MGRRVVVLAEDLIWQQRLAEQLAANGETAIRAATTADLERELADADAVIVDLAARRVDPIAALEQARDAGVRVLGIGPHDDQALRRRAMAAGAERVLAYRKLFEDGPATLAAWLDGSSGATRSAARSAAG
jgi:DNA-binding NarL/FixJ family response regulator